MKRILIIVFFVLLAVASYSQSIVKGTGIIYVNAFAELPASPSANEDAEVGFVISEAQLYRYVRSALNWQPVGAGFDVEDGQTIDFTFTDGVLTAEIATNGATDGQYLQYDAVASEWQPVTLIGEDIAFTDLGDNFTTDNVGAGLNQLADEINALEENQHDRATEGVGNSTALNVDEATQEITLTESTLETNLNVDDLKTLSGVVGGSQNLGTFSGNTIDDNATMKQALQLIETALELLGAQAVIIQGKFSNDTEAGLNNVAVGDWYELDVDNPYGESESTPRRRQN